MSELVLETPRIFGWKFRPDPACIQSVYNRLKLLKLQTLRINDDYEDYSTKRSDFGGLRQAPNRGSNAAADGSIQLSAIALFRRD